MTDLKTRFFSRSLPQANLRKSTEASVSLLEKDKIMLQHRFTEYQRKADQEAEKRRNLENEGKDYDVPLDSNRYFAVKVYLFS